MRPLVPLLALLVIAPMPAQGAPEDLVLLPHPPIVITSDADFASPLSGVVGGSGTAEDPYVISGWRIVNPRGFGIRLENTTAHVVIERVDMDLWHSVPHSLLACNVHLDECSTWSILDIRGASNVEIRDMTPAPEHAKVFVIRDAHRIHIHDVTLTSPAPPPFEGLTTSSLGVVIRSDNVTLERIHAEWRAQTLYIFHSSDVALRDSFFSAEGDFGTGIVVWSGQGARFSVERSTFVGGALRISDPMLGLRVADSLFRDSKDALRADPDHFYPGDFVFCRNRFEGTTRPIEVYATTGGGLVAGNVVLGGEEITISRFVNRPRALIEGNHFEVDTLRLSADAHHNSFLASTGSIGSGDMRQNWWGSVNGPSGFFGNATVSPWLIEAPPLRTDC